MGQGGRGPVLGMNRPSALPQGKRAASYGTDQLRSTGVRNKSSRGCSRECTAALGRSSAASIGMERARSAFPGPRRSDLALRAGRVTKPPAVDQRLPDRPATGAPGITNIGTRQGIWGKAVEHFSMLPTSHGLVPLADGYEVIATHWGITWVNRISISADVTARPLFQVYAYDDPSNSCESYTPGLEWKQMALKLAAAGHYQLEKTWSVKTKHDVFMFGLNRLKFEGKGWERTRDRLRAEVCNETEQAVMDASFVEAAAAEAAAEAVAETAADEVAPAEPAADEAAFVEAASGDNEQDEEYDFEKHEAYNDEDEEHLHFL
ncbi:hypothetical protein ABBQ32_010697 [Trebouxia sp. C0010 RCD-2024]